MTWKKDKFVILAGVLLVVLFLITGVPVVVDTWKQMLAKKVVGLWRDLAEQYAAYWNWDAANTLAIICYESGGNPNAVNPADPSKGLMAITPGALADFNRIVGRSYTFDQMLDPALNIEVGTWYISTRFNKTNNLHKAFAAYNAGLGNIPAGEGYAQHVEVYLQCVQTEIKGV
jgi:soluble lytic murein transglycosylase